eukprot:760910-Hanusia_phi.AAC.1
MMHDILYLERVEQAEGLKEIDDCEGSEPSTKRAEQSADDLESSTSNSNHTRTAEPCKKKSKKKTSLWERSQWKGGRRMAKRNAQTSKSHFAAYDRTSFDLIKQVSGPSLTERCVHAKKGSLRAAAGDETSLYAPLVTGEKLRRAASLS